MSDATLRLRGDAVTWRMVNDEIVALDLRQSEYLTFTSTGRVLWEALAEGATHGQLVSCVVEQFAIDAQTASDDIAAFLEDLDERGLVERR